MFTNQMLWLGCLLAKPLPLSLPRTSMTHPKHISHASSHTRCTACLQISAEHVSNTHMQLTHTRRISATQIHMRAAHAAHTAWISIEIRLPHMLPQHSHSDTKRSLLVFAICKWLYSLFPSHHLHHCYYNNYLPRPTLSSFAASLSTFTAVQATRLSLSFLASFVQSSLLLLLEMLHSVFRWGSPALLIHSHVSPVYLFFHISHGHNRHQQATSYPAVHLPSIHSSFSSHSLLIQPFFSLSSVGILAFLLKLTSQPTTAHSQEEIPRASLLSINQSQLETLQTQAVPKSVRKSVSNIIIHQVSHSISQLTCI